MVFGKWARLVKKARKKTEEHFDAICFSDDFGLYADPSAYAVFYAFKTDAELEAAKQNGLAEEINQYHRACLEEVGYPAAYISDCSFATEETCDRDYDSNWYYYFK